MGLFNLYLLSHSQKKKILKFRKKTKPKFGVTSQAGEAKRTTKNKKQMLCVRAVVRPRAPLARLFSSAGGAPLKELRERTGAGLMDCKKALEATGNDLDKAAVWLREKGLAKAAKRSAKQAAFGLVGARVENGFGAIVELNSETDFMARNEAFVGLVGATVEAMMRGCPAAGLGAVAAEGPESTEFVKALALPGGAGTVAENATALVAKTGENVQVRRAAWLKAAPGQRLGMYLHQPVEGSEVAGKMASLVLFGAVPATGQPLDATTANDVALHVAAMNPIGISPDTIPKDKVAAERAIFEAEAASAGKNAEVTKRMVDGKLRKWFEEVALTEQRYCMADPTDPKPKISDRIQNAPILGLVRFKVGEGVVVEAVDFASEVAKQIGKQ
jgi:elongation factor Ts